MGELKKIVDQAETTQVHSFIKFLVDQKKLLRCYTQNIDCLENRLGLTSDIADKVFKITERLKCY